MKWSARHRSMVGYTKIGYVELATVLLIRAAFAVAAGITVWQGNYETASIVFIGLVVSFVPQIIERNLKVRMPLGYELIIVLFVFASIFLGEVNKAYVHFWWWDIALHASSGVLMGYVGFLILYSLYLKKQLVASAGVLAFFAFCVGLASAGVWEIFEFTVDETLGKSMQHGLIDTMSDTIVACIGSLLAAGAAYWHIKWPDSSPIARSLNHFFATNPDLYSSPKKIQRKKA